MRACAGLAGIVNDDVQHTDSLRGVLQGVDDLVALSDVALKIVGTAHQRRRRRHLNVGDCHLRAFLQETQTLPKPDAG